MVTFEDVRKNEEVRCCIIRSDDTLKQLGYTEHSFVHAGMVSKNAARILSEIGGYSERDIELAKIAGYMHDIGNMVNRYEHAQSGAILAYSMLIRMGMSADEATMVASAIGNHDEGTGNAVHHIAAAIILADKTDVRRSRVRRDVEMAYDIHDRVNYAVEECNLIVDNEVKRMTIDIKIDTDVSSMMDFFEIFLGRMIMCRRSAEYFGMKLRMLGNGSRLA